MKQVIKLFIEYPFYSKLIIFLFLISGVFSYNSLKKSSFPEKESKRINISVSYPGASPKQMEEGVTTLIENALRGIPGIKESTSTSVENRTTVNITVEENVKTENVLTEIKNAVDGISNLPSLSDRPIVNWVKSRNPAYFFNLSGDMSLLELKKYADKIEDELLNSQVVSQVSFSGIPDLEISIEIKEENLQRYKISFTEIQKAISNNNLDITAGIIRNPREEVNILSRMRSIKTKDIENIIVRSSSQGAIIRIKDIANVKYQFKEGPIASFIGGEPTIRFTIMKLKTEDLIEISNYVSSYIDTFNEKHEKLNIIKIVDFSDILNSRLDVLSSNGVIGILLVILFLSLFLNTRLALWVAWGIPASFLGMFVIMHFMDISINLISLFGMIMVIGILVDDGVVIGENIFAHYEKGKNPREAAIDGTMEVMPAIITSVSTTMIAFTPLMFLTGHMSMIREMAIVVIACLAISIIEGVFVLPSHLAHKKVIDKKYEFGIFRKLKNNIDKFFFLLRDNIYIPTLSLLIKHKWASLSFVISCLLITVGLMKSNKIGTTFFPNVESDYFSIDLALKPGTSVDISKAYLLAIQKTAMEVSKEMTEKYSEDTPVIKYIELNTGTAFNSTEVGTHAGSLRISLKDIENVIWSVSELKRKIAKKVGKIPEAVKFAVGASSRWGAPVSISLLSRNEKQLFEASNWFKEKLREIPELYNIMDNNRLGNQEIRIEPNKKAYVLGLSQAELMNQVRQAFYGGQAQRLVDGKNEIRIYVRYPLENRITLGQLENMKIKTSKGMFPLQVLAKLSIDRSPVSITRFNGQREITVEAFQKNPSQALSPVIEMVDLEILPLIKEKFPEVNYTYRGQMKDSNEEKKDLMSGFIIAFMCMAIIIMISFKSFYQGILVLLAIPLGFISAIWGHGIEGLPISLLSMFGMIALSGTIINDAVVFLTKYNINIKSGMKIKEALIETGESRFRPILLTSVTTVAGLYPIILETSMQAQFLIPMAVSLAYGIFIGTLFIIFFFPVFIMCGNSINLFFKSLFTSKALTREDVEPIIIQEKFKNKSDY